jgi:hypothetical protein
VLIAAVPWGATDRLAFLRDAAPDASIVAFTVLLALACALGSGFLATWAGARMSAGAGGLNAMGVRTTAGSPRVRLRDVLVGTELAFTVVLLVGAALVGRSLARLANEDFGSARSKY